MTTIRIDRIIHGSYVDGPGRRSVLFMQGCPLGCPGCQNPHLWPATGGRPVEAAVLAAELMAGAVRSQGRADPHLTISGGEPFAQAETLAELAAALRDRGAGHLIIYSGYTLEQLQAQSRPAIERTLSLIDVLVDGPYRLEQDSPWLQYRGSRNQRAIDMPATLTQGRPVLLDWDRPEIIITQDGEILGVGPVVDRLSQAGLGPVTATRRCGQTGTR